MEITQYMKRFWVNITNLHGIYGVEEGKTSDQAYFSARGKRLKKKYQKRPKKVPKKIEKKKHQNTTEFISHNSSLFLWPFRVIKAYSLTLANTSINKDHSVLQGTFFCFLLFFVVFFVFACHCFEN